MASRNDSETRNPRPVYRTNGAAAYDIRTVEVIRTGTAAPKLPEPKRQPHARPKPKAKTAVAPLSVVGLLAAACMLIFVICGYVQLFEETTAVNELRDQLTEAQEYQQRLQATYNSKIDLDVIQQQAARLGMTVPNSKQTVYLSLKGSDKAVISGTTQENVLKTAWNAISRSVRTLLEYFG